MRSDRGFPQQVASGHRVTIDFSFGYRVTDDFKVWSQGHGGFWPVTNCDPGRSRHYSVNGSDRPLMMIWDFKQREGDALFRHLQGSQGRVLTPREATEAPTQRSRSPLSPTEVTESATVRLFLILSACALLCSLRPGFCIVCEFAHARPIMLQHSTSRFTM